MFLFVVGVFEHDLYVSLPEDPSKVTEVFYVCDVRPTWMDLLDKIVVIQCYVTDIVSDPWPISMPRLVMPMVCDKKLDTVVASCHYRSYDCSYQYDDDHSGVEHDDPNTRMMMMMMWW